MKEQQKHATITVTGTGAVKVAPDEAVVRLSVVTEAETAAAATAANAERTLAVIEAVSSEPNHDVSTSGLTLWPTSRVNPETREREITGFRASNSVSVKTKVGYAGQIFDVGVKAGANQSSGIDFRLQDDTKHRDEALTRAVQRALAQASTIAQAAELKLGAPASIELEPGLGEVELRGQTLELRAASTPASPEELTIAVTVRVVFHARR
ncbi:MAG: SIMPL domain-containing protein [Myxococcales bacterium]|nr:SIMPL domain-containing protein [Myxococcales bacterium]MCB9755191.1 SIMPL domain-containing protein [Myxococcales bacterium]